MIRNQDQTQAIEIVKCMFNMCSQIYKQQKNRIKLNDKTNKKFQLK